jgi:ERCC4-type nuclease
MGTIVEVDDRETPNSVTFELDRLAEAELRPGRLSAGDYLVDNRLLFERKTISDLARSIADGRLFRQALLLAASDYRPVLLLEGTRGDADGLRVSREAMQGALISVSVIMGVPVLRSAGPAESAWLIVTCARQVDRAASDSVFRPGHRPRGRRGRQLYILQGLPKIGKARAERLLGVFGSVQGVMNARYEDLLQVEGIGKGTARKIVDVLKEELERYAGQ